MMSGVDSKPRKAFTPGWEQSLSTVEGLPIKAGGKIVHIHRTAKQKVPTDDDDEIHERIIDDEEDNEVDEPVKAAPVAKGKKAAGSDGEKKSKKLTLQERLQSLKTIPRSEKDQFEVQQHIANICMHITAAPEPCIMKKRKTDEPEDSDGEESYHINDLFQLLESSNDAYLLEITLLSTALVFKDICPSYRIRTKEDQDSDQHHEQQLKKETKKLIEYETSLISAYQKYLQYLDQFTTVGLGNPQSNLGRQWTLSEQTGFIALRCQCELLKSLYAFNLRTVLLTAITSRATQMHPMIHQLCCESLNYVVEHDVIGDVSFEFVGLLNKMLKIAKFTIPDELLKVLQHIKITVHADDSKKYQKMAKNEKKKRKRMKDEVLAGMMEADANGDVLAKKRFQANALQEISLVYFRILKQKVGFNLLPTALEGLGRITHLLDMDTVVDLMAVLRSMLEAQPPVPLNVRVLCVHCALKTLSGPGEELKIDDEVYLTHLRHCLREVPQQFNAWNSLLECMDICLLKKREERVTIVAAIVRLLFMNVSMHMHDFGPVLLAFVHMILLRYPRVRQEIAAIKSAVSDIQKAPKGIIKSLGRQLSDMEEDRVEDLAMKALIDGEASKNAILAADDEESQIGDGSWLLPLIKHSVDKNRYRHIGDTMMVKDLVPLPLRLSDVNKKPADIAFDRLDAALSACPPASQLFGGKRDASQMEKKPSNRSGQYKNKKSKKN